MKKYEDSFWNKIEDLHNNQGISITKLSKDYHFDKQTYSNWCVKKRNMQNKDEEDEIIFDNLDDAMKEIRKLRQTIKIEREKVRILKKVMAIVQEDTDLQH